MSNALLVQLFRKLSNDTDDAVREIGKRCLRQYDEFAGMRYARLTALDEQRVVSAAIAARESADMLRARMLDDGAAMIRSSLRS